MRGLQNRRGRYIPLRMDIEVSPFSDEYYQQELEFYGFTGAYQKDDLKIFVRPEINGVLDDYLNRRFRIALAPNPVLYRKGNLWMSLTPMEVQSQWVVIQLANGNTAIGGLGLGYTALRMMTQNSVDKIDVYEIDPNVVEFFITTFGKRAGFNKLSFIVGDMRNVMKGTTYDFVYTDIYQTMLPDEVISDIRLFNTNNNIGLYRFWGQERLYCDAVFGEDIEPYGITEVDRQYLLNWVDQPMPEHKGTLLNQMWRQETSLSYIKRTLAALKKVVK